MNNIALKVAGNLILIAVVAWIADVTMPWSVFDMEVADFTTLVTTSTLGWAVSLTIGWGRFWYGVGYIISEIPWFYWVI